ncbi:MAG TPA: efflux RND transporter periplasmic adaptor subunit [Puia sp.]|jgi:membrane fusion protein (multidrug efflux system)|nr:efflux RND transporter periplasmic adaptor subunit [Puia sp.]
MSFGRLLCNAPVIALLIFCSACNGKVESANAPKTAPAPVVDVLVVTTQSVSNELIANGTVVANEYVELHPEASGRLIYLNVPEGKYVTAGTIIARVNDADLKAQVEKSKVQLELAQKTEARYKQLLAVNGMNQSDYDVALNAVNGFKADIDYNQALLEKTVLRAPFGGILGLRQVSLGAYVSPATLIATLQQLDKIKIDFTVPEQYNGIIKKGTYVDVESEVSTQKLIKAQIIAIEPQINQSSRNLVVRAVLEHAKANPGGFVKVHINAGIDKKAIMVPTNSLIPDDKNNQIILIREGKALFLNVKTGIRKANNVEITSGVKEGDTVVVTGVLFAKPGLTLQVRSSKTLEQFAAMNGNTAAE